ncbi:hypothetical protein DYB28_010536 [Aphanomyces astaci]|uniref:Uncharacterized protein n=1 Tax=Aphanomyces astaci TaxID=112090 RepID=A0A9X8H8C5_APHAT|nr:hypothetical protein DYB28_010536 [Aphanomyces astaci]
MDTSMDQQDQQHHHDEEDHEIEDHNEHGGPDNGSPGAADGAAAPNVMDAQQLQDAFDSVHRRLDALEETVESIPERIWSALDGRVGVTPSGIGVTNVINLAIKALTDAILISAAPDRFQKNRKGAVGNAGMRGATNDLKFDGRNNGKKLKAERLKRGDHHDSSPSTLLLLSNAGNRQQVSSPITIPNTRRHPKVEVPAGMPRFAWSDGSKQFAPQGWLLPTTSSRAMWELWFGGDDNVGPFQHLTAKDLEDATSKVNLSCARGVMVTLIQIALDQNLVPSVEFISTMTPADRANLFDQVFPRLIQNEPADVVEKAPSYTYTNAYKRLIKGKRKAQRSVGFDASGHKLPNLPAVHHNAMHGPDWEFPATNCKTMWFFWFKGDDSNGIGPFRHFRPRDIDKEVTDGPARRQFSRARGVMEKLVDIAISHGFAVSVDELDHMSPVELETVFDQAFDVLMHDSPDGSLVGDAPGQLRPEKMAGYSYGTVYSAMSQRKRKRADDETGGQYEL